MLIWQKQLKNMGKPKIKFYNEQEICQNNLIRDIFDTLFNLYHFLLDLFSYGIGS